jgi:hypothetical protein
MTASTRYDRWMRRVHVQQLGIWGERWADLSATAQFAAWCRLAEERGASASVEYYMTRGLLGEVIYAAGGVERELGQLSAALADVQRFADEAATHHPLPSPENWPPWGYHVSTPAMRDVSYSFVNQLSWARSTIERTDRPYRPGSAERAGLLPALVPSQLHDSVEEALRDLKAALRDSRLLVNYCLHAGAVPGGGTPRADILPDGRLLARLPDLVRGAILTWEEFTFDDDRDMLTYATEAMNNVETFIDKVLDAFAADRPQRVGPQHPWPS